MRDQDRHPPEPWAFVERGIKLDRLAQTESLFALANGHIGLRGNLDEGEPVGVSGTYLNGFYESYPLQYGERGYGFAEDGQTVVNVPDGKIVRLQVEDEPLDIHRGTLEHHERRLDFRSGVLERDLRWRTASGVAVKVSTKRLVSLSLRSVAAILYEVEAVDQKARIALQSNLQVNRMRAQELDDPRGGRHIEDALRSELSVHDDVRVVLGHVTRASGLSMASGMDHVIECDSDVEQLTQSEADLGRVTMSVELQPGEKLRVVKFVSYHWSSQQSVEWLRDQVDASLESAIAEGFDGLVEEQREILDRYWERADIQVEGDEELQQALRFAMFHIFQSAARNEGRAIPAKGLTGTGYDGHAFWDTETFVLPLLTFTAPATVRHALIWRHSILDAARDRAEQLHLRGAAMPWRTIHGEECSGYWPAGTAAFHVNADIADAVRRYVMVTGDVDFEEKYGCELLVETARLWESLGHHDDYGTFRIDGVTGPDEYSALVDNNVFTNLMAQLNLESAYACTDRHPEVAKRLGVDEEEREAWKRAADAMYIPFDEKAGVHPQDDSFLHHQRWDFENTPEENYPLLLHYPYFQLYREQVIKQADLVLAMQIRGDAFTPEQKLANFDYYEPLCVRDSSLSAATQAVIAAEVGHLELAKDYLYEASHMDIADLERNTADGLHMASLAGAVIATVAGFGGLREQGGKLRFQPRLPEGIDRLCFGFELRGTLLRVEVLPGEATYRVERGDGIHLTHWGEAVDLTAKHAATLPIPAAPDLPTPSQPPGREPGRRRPRRPIDYAPLEARPLEDRA
ncbi:MAG TPA: glycosyl hydrolase family 65 protein [Thermoleophilaceae bacterium]|nr:glycosyl hydrolase family 65 protein [Thermoleophilaceae bacterium]